MEYYLILLMIYVFMRFLINDHKRENEWIERNKQIMFNYRLENEEQISLGKKPLPPPSKLLPF